MDGLKDHDPAHIGAFALVGRLGAGGMGQVYLGRSPGGRLVAVKVIRDEITDHPETLARFRREVKTVRAVRSPYTAGLVDASLDEAPYWLATEYVEGPTLRDAVRERGAFPAVTCRGVFAALAEGLASVHAYGVTHRDLKPGNVMLGAQGPQLIDFGIARGVSDDVLTMAGQSLGTPGYAAPEVILRNEVGPAADVFALGATMAYVATGRAPFGVGEAAGIGYRVVHEEIGLDGVEEELGALIKACVAKEPGERPGLDEVIARCGVRSALVDDAFYRGVRTERAQEPEGDEPTLVAPVAAPEAVRPRRRRVWRAVVVAGLVVVAAAVSAVELRPPGGGDGGKGGGGSVPKVPGHVEAVSAVKGKWSSRTQDCDPSAEEPVSQGQTVVQGSGRSIVNPNAMTGKARIQFRLRGVDTPSDASKPYYVSLLVRPPHHDDRGYATKPVNLFAKGVKGALEGITVTYPDDFTQRSAGKTRAAIPLSADPGDWTLLVGHVKSEKEYAVILCGGFQGG
ncbi:serine/threonine-protein kinase [Streptomyces sp. NBC_01465]|uniref:serine/threonine-protein kinase n=1 Tax=Streptomyces sp. NBC_01465 TaxID=2903878 RepID=UPI002E354CD2|nr:serine/threonine-protein kinase [Streptomyces sp. NBC_01465]